MAIQVALTHRTHYFYDKLVNLAPQIVRLRPAPHCRTPLPHADPQLLAEGHTQTTFSELAALTTSMNQRNKFAKMKNDFQGF